LISILNFGVKISTYVIFVLLLVELVSESLELVFERLGFLLEFDKIGIVA